MKSFSVIVIAFAFVLLVFTIGDYNNVELSDNTSLAKYIVDKNRTHIFTAVSIVLLVMGLYGLMYAIKNPVKK